MLFYVLKNIYVLVSVNFCSLLYEHTPKSMLSIFIMNVVIMYIYNIYYWEKWSKIIIDKKRKEKLFLYKMLFE